MEQSNRISIKPHHPYSGPLTSFFFFSFTQTTHRRAHVAISGADVADVVVARHDMLRKSVWHRHDYEVGALRRMRLAVNAISHCDRIAVRSVSVCGRRARMTRAEWMVMCSVDWQLEGPCQYNVAEIRVNVDRGDTLPAASIWEPTACQHQHLKGSWDQGGLYKKKNNPEISAFVTAYSSVCPLHVVIRVMPWPVATAILPLVLSPHPNHIQPQNG